MGESYSETPVETAAAMLLTPKPAGVLANNRYQNPKTPILTAQFSNSPWTGITDSIFKVYLTV